MKRHPRRSATLLLVMATAGLTACAGGGGETSYRAISDDLTPELMATNERAIDVDRSLAVTNNLNLRSFWSDLGRVFYTDRPNPLSPYDLPALGGQPR